MQAHALPYTLSLLKGFCLQLPKSPLQILIMLNELPASYMPCVDASQGRPLWAEPLDLQAIQMSARTKREGKKDTKIPAFINDVDILLWISVTHGDFQGL